MSRNLERLRKGQRWWAAEVVLRSLGVLLLSVCYRLGTLAHRWVTATPVHQATGRELAVCLAIVVCLTGGIAFTMFGPKLFEHVPDPRRSALNWKS